MYRFQSGPFDGFADVSPPTFDGTAKLSSGAGNSFSRANQFLPGDWTHLGRGDLDRISRILTQSVRAERPTYATVEACLMIEAMLSTGRKLEDLIQVELRLWSERHSQIEVEQPGLLLVNAQWSWWLPAGGPERKPVDDPTQMVPVVPNAWLPVSQRFLRIFGLRLEKRPVRDLTRPAPLFRVSEDLLVPKVAEILSASPRGSGIPRRSATTVEAAERWMLSALLHQPGGDLATASIVTARRHSMARPMVHYGSVFVDRAVAAHRQSMKRLGKLSHRDFPVSLADKAVGEPATPLDSAVKKLIEGMLARVRNPNASVAERHEAMTEYTFALLSFAAALRGGGKIPGWRGIDPATGFATIIDKYAEKSTAARMSWICNLARQQLRHYETHLDLLADHLGIAAKQQLTMARTVAGWELPLVEVVDRYRVKQLSFSDLKRKLKQSDWPGESNAGRHWIRSKLVGRCSHETLSAFFGHWQIGAEPWRDTSALDPLLYRADLERVLDGTLEAVGWQLCPSPLATASGKAPAIVGAKDERADVLPEKLGSLADCVAPRPGMTPSARVGQLLASAIFHGALLDQRWWTRWLEAACTEPVCVDDVVWLELKPLDPKGSGSMSLGRRWFADPVTRALLGNWHGRGGIWTSSSVEDCLSEYLVGAAGDTAAIELLMKHAERRWSLHMPPLLVAHAKGGHRSVPVDHNNWNRVLGFEYREVPLPESPPVASAPPPWCAEEAKVIARAKRRYKKGLRHHLSAKRAAAEELGKIEVRSPAHKLMNQWCIDAFSFDRGRDQNGFAPSTVQNYLKSLCQYVVSESVDLLAMSSEGLVEFFDKRLAAIGDIGRQGVALKAIRSLYHTLKRQRGDLDQFPPILEDYRHDQRASANLISPLEYERALRSCRNDMQRACLILGFRCGLRFDEVRYLTVHDFYVSTGIIELTIIRNEHRKLKTPTSRRVLLLNVLLDRREADLLRKLINRKSGEFLAASGQALLFNARSLSEGFEGKGKLEHAFDRLLSSVAKVPCKYHHLRHSFASYLLATLLLPDGCPEKAIPAALRDVISLQRKSRVSGPLLGSEKLGQHSLHALSQALGHIVPYTTTGWYCHLLDLSVQQYVSRPIAEALLPKDEVLQLTGRSRPSRMVVPQGEHPEPRWIKSRAYWRPYIGCAATDDAGGRDCLQVSSQLGERTRRWERKFDRPNIKKHQFESQETTRVEEAPPDWRTIKAAIDAPDKNDALAYHPHALRWRKAARFISGLLLKSGVPRHQLNLDRHLRSAKWISYLDARWHADMRLSDRERQALFFVIDNWDTSRGGVRFKKIEMAATWRELLLRSGFKLGEIEVRRAGKRLERRSQAELHAEIERAEKLRCSRKPPKSRGSIGLHFRSLGKRGRQARSAGYALIVMLAIREGYGIANDIAKETHARRSNVRLNA